MTTTFVNLPSVAANGAGTAVDVSTFACTKTIVNGGNGYVYEPQVAIEISNDAGGVNWTAIYTFQGPGEITLNVVARWMRTRVSNYRGGTAPNVDAGADLEAAAFAALTAPVGNGPGTAVDTSTLPLFKTVQVVGPFRGTLNINVSEDGTDYGPWMSFSAPGVQSLPVTAMWMRVERVGVPQVDPGTPSVAIAADTGPGGGGGGGGGGGVDVQNEEVDLAGNPYSTLDFASGVKADDVGGVVARVRSAVAMATLTLDQSAPSAGPEVFDVWADLYAKLVELRTSAGIGQFTIQFAGAPIIPSDGVTYDMTGCVWQGTSGAGTGSGSDLTIGDGGDSTIFENLRKISGVNVVTFQSQSPIKVGVGEAGGVLTLVNLIIGGEDSNEPIEILGTNSRLVLGDYSTLANIAVQSDVDYQISIEGVVRDEDVASIQEDALAGSGLVTVLLKEGSGRIEMEQTSLTNPLEWLSVADSRMISLAWPFLPPVSVPTQGDDPKTAVLTVGYTNLMTGGPTASLPSAGNYQKGDFIAIKTADASGCTIVGDDGDTIDGAASYLLDLVNQYVVLVSNGVDGWLIISAGGGASGGGIAAVPEQWALNTGLLTDQVAVSLETQVSTGFATYRAPRAGSIRDLGWRLSAAVTAGTLTINVTVNGTPIVLAGVSTSGSNASGGQSTQAAGIANFVAGDEIGVTYSSDALLAAVGAVLEVTLNVQFTT